jgi:hypothetical protein
MYWDVTSMRKLVPGEPYPSPTLVTVTHNTSGGAPSADIIEAWELQPDGQTMIQHVTLDGQLGQSYRRVWRRLPCKSARARAGGPWGMP